MEDPRIILVYGGVGPEREVSLISGACVQRSLESSWIASPLEFCELKTRSIPLDWDAAKDLIFPVLHGDFGEDGEFQAVLEAEGFEFCGTDSTGCKVSIDKSEAKRRVSEHGIRVVEGLVFNPSTGVDSAALSGVGECLVIKPRDKGSSVGLQFVESVSDASKILDELSNDSGDWIIEQRIVGREFSVGLVDGEIMEVVEIITPSERAYDYEQKYHRSDTEYIAPAPVDSNLEGMIKRWAEKAFEVCDCRDFARVDFLYDNKFDQLYFLEINTHPGMTPTSLLPKGALQRGLDFDQLILKMIEPGLKRFYATK